MATKKRSLPAQQKKGPLGWGRMVEMGSGDEGKRGEQGWLVGWTMWNKERLEKEDFLQRGSW